MFISFIVVLPLLLIFSGCKNSQQNFTYDANVQEKQMVETPKPSVSVGGGYKGIKWGTSRKEVVQGLGMNPATANDKMLTFKYEGKELTCFFYNNQFYKVLFEPGLGDGDKQGTLAILQSLRDKYGDDGTQLDGYVDGLGIPLSLYEWNDGETQLRFQMCDPKFMTEIFAKKGYGGDYINSRYPSSTVKVIYMAIDINFQKESDEKNAKEKAEESDRNEKKQKFKNDF